MSAAWKTVRVFISSTFRDMQAERDHLVRFVFPKLRQELLQRRIHLVDVDLRWGVTSDQDASEVCREVVDECHPRFLCMLGGRYGCVPKGKPRSITADEIHYGVLDREATQRGFSNFYFRDDNATAAMVETTEGEFREPQGSDSQKALAKLKQDIADAALNPFTYPAQWDEQSRRLIGLAKFGEQVYTDLLCSMKADSELRDRFKETAEKLDEFAEENAAMEAFIAERTERFVLGSRKAVMGELLAHANGTGGNGYLCLVGEPGSGKSALLAHFSQIIQQPASSHEHPLLLIPHFVGASPGSTDVRRTLRRLCHELVAGAELTAEIPEDPEKLRVAFAEILQQAADKKRVVILLDAINQFDINTELAGWSWLPDELPPNARIFISTLCGPTLDSLRQRRQPPRPVQLKPLDTPDREAIITEFLNRYRKSMTIDQRAALLSKADAGTPLYLLVALEELRTLGTYEEITSRIAQLPPDTRALFIWILKRLEDDDGFREALGKKIGRELVSRFVSLLGASRHGLSQQELVELLSPGDPQGNVAALAQLLRPYLMQRGELLDFYHGQFREAAATSYLPSKAQQLPAHDQLATYFRDKADPEGNQGWKGQSLRPFLELPFHLARSDADKLTQILFDLNWLQAKTDKALVYELLWDYDEDLIALPVRHPQRLALELVKGALLLSAHVISKDKNQLAGQLAGRLNRTAGPDVAKLLNVADMPSSFIRFHPMINSLANPGGALDITMVGHDDRVLTVAITRDGTEAISVSMDNTARIWALQSGLELAKLPLPNHIRPNYILVSSNGRWAVLVDSLSVTGCMVYDAVERKFTHALNVPEGAKPSSFVPNSTDLIFLSVDGLTTVDIFSSRVTKRIDIKGDDLVVARDNKLALTISGSVLRLWDLYTADSKLTIKSRFGALSNLAISPDGRYAATVVDESQIEVYDLVKGQSLHVFSGHTDRIWALAMSPDCRHLVSGGGDSDRSIRLWNLEQGVCQRVLTGHSRVVTGLAFLPNGRRVISSSKDASLRIWNLFSSQQKSSIHSHSNSITHLNILPRTRRVLTASLDGSAKLWDADSLNEMRSICIPSARVEFLTLLGNEELALTLWSDGVLRECSLSTDEFVSQISNLQAIALVVFSGEQWFASAQSNGEVIAWNLANSHQIAALRLEQGGNIMLEAIPGKVNMVLIASSREIAPRLWDVEANTCQMLPLTMIDGETAVRHIAVSSDGKRAFSVNATGHACVWNLLTRQLEQIINGQALRPDLSLWVRQAFISTESEVALLSFGKLIGLVGVVDFAAKRAMGPFPIHNSGIIAFEFYPQLRLAITTSTDNTIKAWDIASGEVKATFTADSWITRCVLNPNAPEIFAGDDSGNLHLLRIDGGENPALGARHHK